MRLLRSALRRALVPLAGAAFLAGGAALPAHAATINVCTGVTGCHIVKYTDVDGDGRTDQVGLVAKNTSNGGTITVRVRTASHRLLQTIDPKIRWFGTVSLAAAPIDGVRGSELVVTDQQGAHVEQFRVITYRAGRLVSLGAPATAAGYVPPTGTGNVRWLIDGSYSHNLGIYRSVSRAGRVTVTTKEFSRNGTTHDGVITSYAWTARGWARTGVAHVYGVSDQVAESSGGWHVAGLGVYPND